MADEVDVSMPESVQKQNDEENRTSAVDYLMSARALSQKIVEKSQRQAEEILRDARARADEIVAEAEGRAEEILAGAVQDAAALREGEAGPASRGDQEHAVRCVEECFDKLRQQHLEAIDLLNTQWQSFLCGLYTGEEPAPAEKEQETVPADLSERVSAIAAVLDSFDDGEP